MEIPLFGDSFESSIDITERSPGHTVLPFSFVILSCLHEDASDQTVFGVYPVQFDKQEFSSDWVIPA